MATPWYDHYPVHRIQKNMLVLGLEKTGVGKAGFVRFDLGGELLAGAGGKAKGKWLPGDDVISGGGFAAGLNVFVRAAYPLASIGRITIAPFVSLGPQVTLLHNNGQDTGPFASRTSYHYTDGWNE